MNQLYELARPFPESLISKKPGGKFQADYVNHAVVTARLLEIVGPYTWEIARIITNADGIAVGCVGRLTCTIDGVPAVIEEIGDVERVSDNSASNLKSASSDALKRATMRLGLGLHLWAGDGYFLDRALSKRIDDGA